MRIVKKFLIWTTAVLVFLIGTGILAAWIFEDEIHLYAIKELGKKLNARIEVRDTELSFFKSFPKVNVRLADLRINSEDSNDPDDFIFVESADLQVNFWSFFSERYEIAGVRLNQPEVKMIHRKDGKWNFGDVFQSDKNDLEPGNGTDLIFELSRVKFFDGRYIFVDELNNTSLRLDSIDLGLSGDLSAANSDVELDFRFFFDHYKDGNLKYVDRRWVNADLEFFADFEGGPHYDIRAAKVRLASLAMDISGNIHQEDGYVTLDLAYATNENSFDSFLSLMPGKWLDTGREYEYGGDFLLNGWVRGPLGPGKQPDCFAEYAVQKGTFQYTGYASKITDANLKGAFLYRPNHPKMSYFKVENLEALLNGKKVDGNVKYTDFEDPGLVFAAHGEVHLEDIRDFYPDFAEESELKGKVFLDLDGNGKIADFKGRNYSAITAAGTMKMEGVSIKDPRLAQAVHALNGSVRVDNNQIEVVAMDGEIGSSDFAVTGKVVRYLPRFFNENEPLVAQVTLRSRNLNLNEWIQEKGPVPGATAEKDMVYRLSVPDWLHVDADARIGHFELANFNADSLYGSVSMKNNRINIPDLRMNTLEGSVKASLKVHVHAEDRAFVSLDADARSINIQQTLRSFDQLAAFALVEDNLSGVFSGKVNLTGEMDERLRLLEESLLSSGDYEIKNGRLVDFKPLEGLAGFVKLESLRDIKFSDVQSSYVVREKFVYLPDLDVKANEYNLHVKGRHGFDNTLDYRVAVELPRKEARRSRNSEIQNWIEEESGDDAIRVVIPIKVTGTVDAPKFSLDGQHVKNSVKQELKNQKEELADAVRNETEEHFGKQDNTNVQDWIIEEGKDTTQRNNGSLLEKLKNPFKKKRNPSEN